MKKIAILLMGGVGSRMQLNIPKQFFKLNQKPLFYYPIDTFLKLKRNLNQIILVVLKKYKNFVIKQLKLLNLQSFKIKVLIGSNKSRSLSLLKALKYIKSKYGQNVRVITHDIARPFISFDLVKKHVNTSFKRNVILNTLLKSSDSLLFNENSNFYPINRDQIYRIQTPQTFYLNDFFKLLRKTNNYFYFNDVVSFYLSNNKKTKIIDGETSNFKITYKSDLKFLALLNYFKN